MTGPLAHLIDSPAIERFDLTVDGWADRLRGHAPADRLFYALSAVGDHGIAWHAVGVARALAGQATWAEAAELSASLGVEAAIVNGPVKMLFRRVRPTSETPRPHRLRQPRTSSFPSGHASAGMYAAAVLSQQLRTEGRGRSAQRAGWYVLGALIGWSRVHVRIHHPSDVVGGFVVGWLLGRVARRFLPSSKVPSLAR